MTGLVLEHSRHCPVLIDIRPNYWTLKSPTGKMKRETHYLSKYMVRFSMKFYDLEIDQKNGINQFVSTSL